MKKEIRHKWILLSILTVCGFILDWFTKYLAQDKLIMGIPHDIIGQYLQFLLVYNKGALFGFNPRAIIPFFPVNMFFFVFSVLAVIVLVIYYRSIPKENRSMHWGLALILPGALGNLFDRVLHAQMGVVDFIKVGISQEVYWPIFNLADVYVTIGVGLLIYNFIIDEKQKKQTIPSTHE